MPISLGGDAPVNAPVLRHQRIGEMAAITIIRTEQRDQLKRNQSTNALEPIPNGVGLNGQPKFKKELVIHGLAMHGTTMTAKIGDNARVPAPGDRVRMILKGKSFGEWIEAKRAHRGGDLQVGDVLSVQTTHAQQYDQMGNAKGAKITDQATADATPRGVTIGFYGALTLTPGTEPGWIEAAENAFHADEAAKRQQTAIRADQGEGEYESPYAAPPVAAPPVAPPVAYTQAPPNQDSLPF